jgi:hypothetical protein
MGIRTPSQIMHKTIQNQGTAPIAERTGGALVIVRTVRA